MANVLRISDDAIQTFKGISIPETATNVVIERCKSLETMEGIRIPRSVTSIEIRECPMLEDLSGFLSTEHPIPSLDIRYCARIRTLPVEVVQAIHRSSRLVLSGLESLEDFAFLTTVSDVTEVWIIGNRTIRTFTETRIDRSIASPVGCFVLRGSQLRDARGIPFGSLTSLEVESDDFSDLDGLQELANLKRFTLTTRARGISVPGNTTCDVETVTLHWKVYTVAYISPAPVDWIYRLPSFFPRAKIHVIVSVPRHIDYDLSWLNAPGLHAIRITVEPGDATPDNTEDEFYQDDESRDEDEDDVYGEIISESFHPGS